MKKQDTKKSLQTLGEGDIQAIANVMGGLLDKQAAFWLAKKI